MNSHSAQCLPVELIETRTIVQDNANDEYHLERVQILKFVQQLSKINNIMCPTASLARLSPLIAGDSSPLQGAEVYDVEVIGAFQDLEI